MTIQKIIKKILMLICITHQSPSMETTSSTNVTQTLTSMDCDIILDSIFPQLDFDTLVAFGTTCSDFHKLVEKYFPPLRATSFPINLGSEDVNKWTITTDNENLYIFRKSSLSTPFHKITTVSRIHGKDLSIKEANINGDYRRAIFTPFDQGLYVLNMFEQSVQEMSFHNRKILGFNIKVRPIVISSPINDKNKMISHVNSTLLLQTKQRIQFWNTTTYEKTHDFTLANTEKYRLCNVLPFGNRFITQISGDNSMLGFCILDPQVQTNYMKFIYYPEFILQQIEEKIHKFAVDARHDSLATFVKIKGEHRKYSIQYACLCIKNISHENPEFRIINPFPNKYTPEGIYLIGSYLFTLLDKNEKNIALFTIYDLERNCVIMKKTINKCVEKTNLWHAGDFLFFPTYTRIYNGRKRWGVTGYNEIDKVEDTELIAVYIRPFIERAKERNGTE